MPIKNDYSEILKLADESIEHRFPSILKYELVSGVTGFLLFYFTTNFLHWLGVLLLIAPIMSELRKQGYRKGFADGYGAGVDDTVPEDTDDE